ncbi:ribosomal-protein-alanine acetyltransferase [Nocardioides szechwanensis]|uniref:[Ribosomal protein bS18]-alanine N-acetyltransferase n=1 Tax=Nocardioides szechwanensis TaxID=1005944 RepID=A0A1H0FWE7_9ACTN|nr:ribosomal protein S18-alanine N-acetyltransferase [Nocardioides szechwanensis]GEP35916.1 ribosomal-protein-alanine acetyltransferase [Nocardioides szechwanensis]SDN98904.1 ribosomal-protein-alanine N-acetyltransferase [Nocardioides szechwanensis]
MIRAATVADVPAIAALEDEALGVDAWSEGLVREGVAGNLPTIHYLVAESDAAVAGYAVASVAGDIAELQRIAVRPDARRTGLASALLDEVLTLAKVGGADRLLLEVRDTNTGALAFYAARGFVEVDRRPRYYRDGAPAVVLRRALLTGCGGG